jgi:hypothetical protein
MNLSLLHTPCVDGQPAFSTAQNDAANKTGFMAARNDGAPPGAPVS